MKKVAIVTLHSVNIGNRLQNLALQIVIENCGYQVVNPTYSSNPENGLQKAKDIIKIFLGLIGIDKFCKESLDFKRKRRFALFDRNWIKNLVNVKFNDTSQLNPSQLLCGITGSDQVWHKWTNQEKELEYFYLTFLPKAKRISYAASFGFEEFPPNDLPYHLNGLQGITYLSCREVSAKKMINDISGKAAKIVLDPTLLLTSDLWNKFSQKPTYKLEDNFILVYCLGEKTEEFYKTLNYLNGNGNYQVIDIYDLAQKKYYLTNPSEFIWLINHANFVLTDSFHAVVFSLLFHKHFIAFRRYFNKIEDKMFDRISTLLNMFDASNFIYSDLSTYEMYNFKYDYNIFDEKLNAYRKDSIDFITSALKNVNKTD